MGLKPDVSKNKIKFDNQKFNMETLYVYNKENLIICSVNETHYIRNHTMPTKTDLKFCSLYFENE